MNLCSCTPTELPEAGVRKVASRQLPAADREAKRVNRLRFSAYER